jgi:AcrR family transcriptional regulator
MARDDRRAALLDAAVRVLQHRVLADLSFEAVAEEAGVSKTLPYSYFDSPAEIAIALFERVVGTIDETTDQIIRSALSFDEKVRATLHLWSDAIESGGQLVHRVLDSKAVAALQPLIERRDRHSVEIWADALAKEFSLTASDAEFVAVMLTSAATSTLRYWADNGLERQIVIEQFLRATRATACEFRHS